VSGPGIPSRVFHGTSHAFDRFEPRHLGRSVRNPTTEFGFFFSEDPEDAEYWAHRAERHGRSGGVPRLVTAEVRVDNPALISPRKFQFYLQRARVSTIQRDLNAWRDVGRDGITTIRDGVRWWPPFDATAIRTISSRPLSRVVEVVAGGDAAQVDQHASRSRADDPAP
jgi:hypothetical protein